MAKLTAALVLVDVVSHGLKAGTIVEAEAGLIKALHADGSVDPHKAAVAYAKSQGANVVLVGVADGSDGAAGSDGADAPDAPDVPDASASTGQA